jgi:hypothetical protein
MRKGQIIKNQRLSPKTEFKKGEAPWNKGIKYTRMVGNKHAFKGDKRCKEQYHYEARNILRYIKICSICGIKKKKSYQMIVHHKNENIKDNRVKNLQKMCRSCHMKHHLKNIKLAYIKKLKLKRHV